MESITSLCQFINKSTTPYHEVAESEILLKKQGFIKLDENKPWEINPGGSYYLTADQSSLIAFKIGLKNDYFRIVASHNDSPGFKIKPNGFISLKNYRQLNTEVYGSPIFSTWFDRLLGMAGRVLIKDKEAIISKLITIKTKALIPSLAIHFNRDANRGVELNPQVDLLPFVEGEGEWDSWLAKEIGLNDEKLLAHDIFLFNDDKAITWGEFLSAPRIDNLECAYGTLVGFLTSQLVEGINVYACFNNEEIGSQTKQGAASTFLKHTLKRISLSLGKTSEEHYCMLANSFMVSADNAHAQHPNSLNSTDLENYVKMNEGIVIKHSARQSYTTDALSMGLFTSILNEAKIPFQSFANRSDKRGGGTLGAISSAQVSIPSIDIGLAQLAMHSAFETSGIKDFGYLTKGIKAFYECNFIRTENGWIIK